RNHEIAVTPVVGRGSSRAEGSTRSLRTDREIPGVVRAAFGLTVKSRPSASTRLRDDVNHPAKRKIAPDTGCAALHDLDPLDAVDRNPAPVHEAAERLIQRDAIDQDERPAGTAAESAQRCRSNRWVRHMTVRLMQLTESSDLQQEFVDTLGRRLLDVLAREHDH